MSSQEWHESTLGLLLGSTGSIKTGPFGTMLKASEYSESGVPVISVGEVGYGTLKLRKDTPRVSPAITSRLSEYVLETNDIVFGRKGAVDRSSIVRPYEDGWFLGSDGIRVRLPQSVNAGFIAYQFQLDSIRTWLLQHASGSTMLSLNQGTLERVPLLIPPLATQQAIAEVLSALDDKIAANSRLAETMAEMATAQFDLRAKTATVSVPLSELVTTQYGVTTSSHEGPGPKFLRVTDINKKPWIEWATTPYCTVNETELEKYKVTTGDILVARMADPGKAAFVDLGDPEAVFASYLVRLRALNTDQALFIYYFLRSTTYRNYAEGAMQGSVQKNMNAKVIVATDIAMPEIGVLREFNEVAAKLRTLTQGVLKENLKLVAVRDALLPRLMSGKLRIQDAEDLISAAI
ncbi:restriction endonuclease subunit S [Glutamicibacter bergerei]|uniref:Restriction endonuclease subunit S n=1 Tax=Glutamicibacter bergerei TaxID=256702 RepID=A0ABV9MGP4_9MICC|nr:hypothetical protein [Micrococcaceae bacterium]